MIYLLEIVGTAVGFFVLVMAAFYGFAEKDSPNKLKRFFARIVLVICILIAIWLWVLPLFTGAANMLEDIADFLRIFGR